MGLFPSSNVVQEIRSKWGGDLSHPPEPTTPEEAVPYLLWYIDFIDMTTGSYEESFTLLKQAITDPDGSLASLHPYSWRTLFYYHHWVHDPRPGRPERWVYNKDREKVVTLPDAPPDDPTWRGTLQAISEAEGVHPTLTLHALLGWRTTGLDEHAYKQRFRDA